MNNSTNVSVRFQSEDSAVLTWADGSSETLSYIGLGNFNTFHFYSNLDLCELALDYYEKQNGYRPSDAIAIVQNDGSILIQLYDNMGDHNSTSAWYTVDKYTASGTDLTGNPVNLAK